MTRYLTAEERQRIKQLLATGNSVASIARLLKRSPDTIYRVKWTMLNG